MRVQARGIDQALLKLEAMRGRVANLQPVLQVVGEMVVAEAKDSIRSESSPDGRAWPQLSDVTILRRITRTSGGFMRQRAGQFGPRQRRTGEWFDPRRASTKSGRATKRALKAFAGNGAKMLFDRGRLFGSLSSTATERTLLFGSDVVYARAQQLGNPDNKMFGKKPAPIPARAFFPVVSVGGGKVRMMTEGRGGEMWARARAMIRQFVLTGRVR